MLHMMISSQHSLAPWVLLHLSSGLNSISLHQLLSHSSNLTVCSRQIMLLALYRVNLQLTRILNESERLFSVRRLFVFKVLISLCIGFAIAFCVVTISIYFADINHQKRLAFITSLLGLAYAILAIPVSLSVSALIRRAIKSSTLSPTAVTVAPLQNPPTPSQRRSNAVNNLNSSSGLFLSQRSGGGISDPVRPMISTIAETSTATVPSNETKLSLPAGAATTTFERERSSSKSLVFSYSINAATITSASAAVSTSSFAMQSSQHQRSLRAIKIMAIPAIILGTSATLWLAMFAFHQYFLDRFYLLFSIGHISMPLLLLSAVLAFPLPTPASDLQSHSPIQAQQNIVSVQIQRPGPYFGGSVA